MDIEMAEPNNINHLTFIVHRIPNRLFENSFNSIRFLYVFFFGALPSSGVSGSEKD